MGVPYTSDYSIGEEKSYNNKQMKDYFKKEKNNVRQLICMWY